MKMVKYLIKNKLSKILKNRKNNNQSKISGISEINNSIASTKNRKK
jgi:hypothetical protein